MSEIKPKKIINITPIPEPEEETLLVIPVLILTSIPIQEEELTDIQPKSINLEVGTVNVLEKCDPITDIEKLKKKLIKLGIRFNTDPKLYQKRDYWLLICILYQALTHLYDIDVRDLMVKEWLNPHSDKYIPTEKLVAETIEELDGKLDQEVRDRIQAVADEAALRIQGDLDLSDSLDREVLRLEGLISDETSARQSADSDLQDNIDSEAGTRASEITRVEGLISAEELARQLAVTNLQNTKLDNLTAGDNISITNNVISAVDTIYDDTEVKSDISDLQLNKLDNLTPGDNISITNNVISAVDTIYDDTEVRGLISTVDQKVDNLDDFECGLIVPTATNFVEGTEYTVHEALQRTANLFEGYQGEIDDINDLIPNQATTQNQLADKAFVNNTVATNAANFRGNWSTWTSVPTNVNDYPEDYTGSKIPTNNDYLVVLDGTGYGSSYTGMWRFIYVGDWNTNGKSGWNPQYRVGSAFTQAQQDAIDSGIISTKVSTYDGYATSIGALQTDKVDKIYTADKVYGTNNQGSLIAYTAGNNISFTNGQINAADLIQSDWSQSNNSAKDFIKNKPTNLSSFTDDLGSSPIHTHSLYLTLHLDISGKEDKFNKVTSISSSSTDALYPSAKCVYDEFATTVTSLEILTVLDFDLEITSHIPVVDKTSETANSFAIDPNKMYMFGTRTSLTVTLNSGVSGIVNEYMFQFTSGSTATTLNVPLTVTWLKDPNIQTDKKYAVSIENNLGIIGEWSNE